MTLYQYTVDLTWPGPGSPGVNVWDLRTTGAAPASGDIDLQTLVDAIEAFYTYIISYNVYPGGYTMTGRNEAVSVPDRQLVATSGFSLTESSPDVMGASVAQMILTLYTSSATRRGRGRKFLGPIAVATMQGDGTPTQAAIDVVQQAANNLLATSEGFANGAVGVYSSVDGLHRDITRVLARNYFAALRSRRD